MISYTKLLKYPSRILKSCTGLTRAEIEILLPAFKQQLSRHKNRWATVSSELRQRKRGAGKPPILSPDDLLLFILFYFRVYPTQDMLGFIFGGHQSWACKWIHRLTPVLESTLKQKKKLPLRSPRKRSKINTFEKLIHECPELKYIIDATERARQRPKDNEKQKEYYSGKKKNHTIKNTVVTDITGHKILYLGRTNPGSKHDKKMVDEEPVLFPRGSTIWMDLGYQGYKPPNVASVLIPTKNRKMKKITESEKNENKRISKTRVHIEHGIGGIKRSKIVSDRYRNRKHDFDDRAILIAAGLHNFRMSLRYNN